MSQNGDGPISAQPPAQSVLDRLMSVRHCVPTRQSRSLTTLPAPPTKTSRARGLLVAIRRITFWIRLNTVQTEGTQVMRKEGYYPSIGVRASVHPSPGCRRQAVLEPSAHAAQTPRSPLRGHGCWTSAPHMVLPPTGCWTSAPSGEGSKGGAALQHNSPLSRGDAASQHSPRSPTPLQHDVFRTEKLRVSN